VDGFSSLGFYSLAVLYAFCGGGSLISSAIVEKTGI
jgi:hypothetical protein